MNLIRVVLYVAVVTFMALMFAPGQALGSCTCKVEGHIYSYSTGAPIVNVRVALVYYDSGFWYYAPLSSTPNPTWTDSNGYFYFQDSYYINTNFQYYVAVNGVPGNSGPYVFGNGNYDNSHGQWFGGAKTDSSGYASVTAYMEESAQVKAPASELFSDTGDAQLLWQTSSSNGYSVIQSFNVAGSGISSGYARSLTASDTYLPRPGTKVAAWQMRYATTFYCAADPSNECNTYAGGTGIRTAGISGPVPGVLPSADSVSEYLNAQPTSDPKAWVTQLPPGQRTFTWTESISSTFSKTIGASFGISYSAFSTQIQIDTTVTTDTSNSHTIGATLTNNSGGTKVYELYPVSACSDPQGCVSAELHVWEITAPNTPPAPGGPNYFQYNTLVTFSDVTTDPFGQALQYKFSWGDGTSTTTGWYASGVTAYASHSWGGAGVFYIKVQAYNGVMWSAWGPSLQVTVQYGHCPPHCSPSP